MGLLKAALSGAKSTMGDQWLEYIQCDDMGDGTLVQVGEKVTRKGTSNLKATDDVISEGSTISVNAGQAMIVVEDGKILDFTCEPGAYTFDKSSEPSLFCGSFGRGLVETFKQIGSRIAYGGQAHHVQRAYFVNLKEIMGNKFGSSQPMPYDDPYYKTVLYIRYFGSYSFRVIDPLKFYTSVAGNVDRRYTVANLIEQINNEFYTALDSSLNSLAGQGVKFSMLPSKQRELATAMNQEMAQQWNGLRGIEMVSVGINKVTPDDKSRERIEQFDNATMLGGNAAAMHGRMAAAQATAFENMGKKEGGASGMDMMGMAFGMNAMGMMNNMMGQQMGQPMMAQPVQPQPMPAQAVPVRQAQPAQAVPVQPAQADVEDVDIDLGDQWKCSKCGEMNGGNFCMSCGEKKPSTAPVPKAPASNEWTCSNCGATCTGKFCQECGTKRNAEKHYKCDKCGWAPADDTKPPKFCPECGDKFGDEDIIG